MAQGIGGQARAASTVARGVDSQARMTSTVEHAGRRPDGHAGRQPSGRAEGRGRQPSGRMVGHRRAGAGGIWRLAVGSGGAADLAAHRRYVRKSEWVGCGAEAPSRAGLSPLTSVGPSTTDGIPLAALAEGSYCSNFHRLALTDKNCLISIGFSLSRQILFGLTNVSVFLVVSIN
jgi:hypothetical protein